MICGFLRLKQLEFIFVVDVFPAWILCRSFSCRETRYLLCSQVSDCLVMIKLLDMATRKDCLLTQPFYMVDSRSSISTFGRGNITTHRNYDPSVCGGILFQLDLLAKQLATAFHGKDNKKRKLSCKIKRSHDTSKRNRLITVLITSAKLPGI